jgi:hypothetical protein
LTIHETCKASFNFDYKETSKHDNLSVTFEERNVYRITRYNNGDDLADLELVSHHKNISSEGIGTFKAPPISESWTYQLGPYRSSPLTGVEVSFTRGWLKVSVPNNPCSFARVTSARGTLGEAAHDHDGYASGPPESEEFQRQLRSTFKPNSKNIAVHGHARFSEAFLEPTAISREVDYSVTGGDSELS